MNRKAPVDADEVQRLRDELEALQHKVAAQGAAAQGSLEVLQQVAKLAKEIAAAGDSVMRSQNAKKEALRKEADKVQEMIKRMGNR